MYASKITFFTILLFMAFHADAQGKFSGSEMLRNCEQSERILATPRGVPSNADNLMASLCLGFMVGLEHGVMVGESASGISNDNAIFCIPQQANNEQRLRVILLYLRSHPERLHEYAAPLFARAYEEAFPCRK